MAGKTLKIATIAGDGTGPEVTAEALKVLAAVAKLEGFSTDVEPLDWGGDRYLRTGEIVPEGGNAERGYVERPQHLPKPIAALQHHDDTLQDIHGMREVVERQRQVPLRDAD